MKIVGDILLQEQARAGAADFPLIEEYRINQPFNGSVEIGVVEDDEGRLATQLQGQLDAAAAVA